MYSIIRHFQQWPKFMSEVVKTGLTKEEAEAYCKDSEGSSETCKTSVNIFRTKKCGAWLCGYQKED